MRSTFYLVLSAIATLVAAEDHPNAFNNPSGGYKFTVGEPTTLKWSPNSDSTVSLKLQSGDVLTPDGGSTIASKIDNSGSYTWTPPMDIVNEPDYTIEIVDDEDEDEVNYLPRFSVSGATATAGSTDSSTASSTGASSASASSTDASTTASDASTTASDATSTNAGASTMTTMTSTSDKSASASSTGASASSSSGSSSSSASGSNSDAAASSTGAQSASETGSDTSAGVVNRASSGLLALALGVAALM